MHWHAYVELISLKNVLFWLTNKEFLIENCHSHCISALGKQRGTVLISHGSRKQYKIGRRRRTKLKKGY